ncbi:MAG: 6-bladed beta-propeller [Bacteroidales bacterium]
MSKIRRNNIVLLILIGLTAACHSKKESVSVLSVNNSPLIVCDEAKVTETREVKLSELVDDVEIIYLDNRDEAFFKFQSMAISDHYMCIWQRDGGAAKLFDRTGKYLCDVGSVGQGPGEYRAVYDVLIDEKAGCVYVASFIGEFIYKYDLNGTFIKKIDFEETVNKPRMYLESDGSLSLVHLCFKDRGSQFSAANIFGPGDSIKYVYVEELTTNFKDKEGKKVGADQEIWSYRNENDFPFMLTSTDTLYHYSSVRNEINAHFTVKMDPEKKGDAFFIFNELPNHFLVFIVGEKGKTILINKESHEAYNVKLVNDQMGGMDVFPRFQDGYFFNIYEPQVLKDKIDEFIQSGSLSEDKKLELESLQSTLQENNNNVVLLGKLKK